MSERHNLRQLLIKHEGVRTKPYRCSAGKLTIGVGRNLDDVGITHFEAMGMLTHDMERVAQEAVTHLGWFQSLSAVRQDVVLSMLFQLGLPRFMGFKNLNEAIRVGNFEKAATEMLDSEWARQTPERAKELALMMRTNYYKS